MPIRPQNAATDQIRAYLFGGLLPFSHRAFVDSARGGFHERLDGRGEPLPLGYKRLLVTCRQIYVFSHAALLDSDPRHREAARHGMDFLCGPLHDDSHGGWFFSVTEEGAPRDSLKDTYAHAFVIFAMAYCFRATGDARAPKAAEEAIDLLRERLAEPEHGGFLEEAARSWEPPGRDLRRRQNPHMHLLEACLAAEEVWPERREQLPTAELWRLFTERFYDRSTGTLGEDFTRDWQPHPETGNRVEPGHHFEWSWILHEYARLRREPRALELADALLEWALGHGLDVDRGGVFDAVDRRGQPVERTKRIWPGLERLKARAVRYERTGEEADREGLLQSLEELARLHLSDDGRWHEHLDERSRPRGAELPGSTGYHLFLALSEGLRVLERRPPETRLGAGSADGERE